MPVNLEKPAKDVDITSARLRERCWVICRRISFGARAQLCAAPLSAVYRPEADVKTWIRNSVAPSVTTAKQQLDQIASRREDKSCDGGLVSGFFLSAEGYEFLGFDTEQFASGTFRKGMKDQSDRVPEARRDGHLGHQQ